MPRQKKQTIVELIPKNDRGTARLSYHRNRWILKRETTEPWRGAALGVWLAVQSQDGKAMLWVLKYSDQDFQVKVLSP